MNPIISLVTENQLFFSQTTLKKVNDEQSQTVINQNWISVNESNTKAKISKKKEEDYFLCLIDSLRHSVDGSQGGEQLIWEQWNKTCLFEGIINVYRLSPHTGLTLKLQ